jgi:hypothetical protein
MGAPAVLGLAAAVPSAGSEAGATVAGAVAAGISVVGRGFTSAEAGARGSVAAGGEAENADGSGDGEMSVGCSATCCGAGA